MLQNVVDVLRATVHLHDAHEVVGTRHSAQRIQHVQGNRQVSRVLRQRVELRRHAALVSEYVQVGALRVQHVLDEAGSQLHHHSILHELLNRLDAQTQRVRSHQTLTRARVVREVLQHAQTRRAYALLRHILAQILNDHLVRLFHHQRV